MAPEANPEELERMIQERMEMQMQMEQQQKEEQEKQKQHQQHQQQQYQQKRVIDQQQERFEQNKMEVEFSQQQQQQQQQQHHVHFEEPGMLYPVVQTLHIGANPSEIQITDISRMNLTANHLYDFMLTRSRKIRKICSPDQKYGSRKFLTSNFYKFGF